MVTISRVDFSSFEVLRGFLPDSASDVMQLGRGRMAGEISHIDLGDGLMVSTTAFSRGIRARGALGVRRVMFGMLLDAATPSLTQPHGEMVVGDIGVSPPGLERYTCHRGATRVCAVLVTPELLGGFADRALWSQPAMLRADPARRSADTQAMTLLLAQLRIHGAALSPGATLFWRNAVLELLTMRLRERLADDGHRVASAARLVREVDYYLDHVGARPVHIAELCSGFAVSRRSLHRAFVEVIGLSPIAFLRHKRLCQVRLGLQNGATSVAMVAMQNGFADHGRFSAAYRRLFGENPSRTLKRGALGCCGWLPLANDAIEWML